MARCRASPAEMATTAQSIVAVREYGDADNRLSMSWTKNMSTGPVATLAVQCHPEVGARHFERWLICNTGQNALMKSHTVRRLRDQETRYADTAAISGQKWFAAWLEQSRRRK